MTVYELIQELAMYRPNTEVVIRRYYDSDKEHDIGCVLHTKDGEKLAIELYD